MTDYIGLIVLIVLCVIALVGFFIGLGKGFMAISSWANEYVIGTFGALLIGVYAGDILAETATWLSALIVIGAGIVIMLVFMIISAAFRKGFARGVAGHRRKLGYLQMTDLEESDKDIMDALARKDYRTYKKKWRSRRKMSKQHRGGWGVVDRIFGAITGAVKYFVVAALIVVSCLLILDITQITVNGEAITQAYLGSIFNSSVWEYIQPYILDFILMGTIFACIRRGYKGGLFSGLWTILAIALVILGFYVSYVIVFKSGTFDGTTESFASSVLAGYLGEGDTSNLIAGIILTAFLGIIFAIIIILLAIFIPKAIEAARETKVFHLVDGVFGAIVVTVIVLAVLLFVFGLLYTLNDLDPLPGIFSKIGSYFEGGVSKYFYSMNFLNDFGWIPNLSQYFG
ncbi:MAG: hypothetical protein LUE27_09710 [Clostridia bacterium]|nr:hypothetical protein [Clostridia bacterium]